MTEKKENKSKKDLLMEKIELKGSRVKLNVDDFIAIFSDEENNKDIITRIKDLAKNGVTIEYNYADSLADNQLIEKDKLENFELSYKNAVKNGIKCRYRSELRFKNGNTYFDVNKTIEATKKINDWADEINNARVNEMELSPLEKFLYVFEIATQFNYRFEDKAGNSNLSRHTIAVLNGDRMVCAGFESIFRHILNRVGIHCSSLLLNSKDGLGGHIADLVYLNDPKYNINGIFVSEPTWGREKKGIMAGKEFPYAIISIENAKKLYGEVNGLKIDDETINESKSKLFESLFAEKRLKLIKTELNERKVHFLENFNGFIVKENVYNLVKREIKYIAKTLKLKQKDLKDYKQNRVIFKKDGLYKDLLDSFLNKFDDFYLKNENDDSSLFDSKSKDLVKHLLQSKYSVEEISGQFLKKLKEFSSKSDEERLKTFFNRDYTGVEDIGDEEAKQISQLRDEILNAKVFENSTLYVNDKRFIKTDYYKSLMPALNIVGLAKGLSEMGAKVYAVGRQKLWKDETIKDIQSDVENDEFYKNMDVNELNRYL